VDWGGYFGRAKIENPVGSLLSKGKRKLAKEKGRVFLSGGGGETCRPKRQRSGRKDWEED